MFRHICGPLSLHSWMILQVCHPCYNSIYKRGHFQKLLWRLKKELSKESLTAVRCPRRTNGTCSCKFDWLIQAQRADLSERWDRASSPFASGWYAMLLILLLLNSFISWLNMSASKCFLMSMLNTAGTPKRHTQRATKESAVVYARISFMVGASHQQEKRSRHVCKYVWSSNVGSGLVMSTYTWANR